MTSTDIELTRKAERYLALRETDPATRLTRRTAKAIATIRRNVQEEIDRLIALLDRIDGDPNLEDPDPAEDGADDEPSLGSTNVRDQTVWAGGSSDTDLERDTADAEPSLGSLDFNIDQSRWANGETLDREPNGDELESAGDEEPDDRDRGLGIVNTVNSLNLAEIASVVIVGPDGRRYRVEAG